MVWPFKKKEEKSKEKSEDDEPYSPSYSEDNKDRYTPSWDRYPEGYDEHGNALRPEKREQTHRPIEKSNYDVTDHKRATEFLDDDSEETLDERGDRLFREGALRRFNRKNKVEEIYLDREQEPELTPEEIAEKEYEAENLAFKREKLARERELAVRTKEEVDYEKKLHEYELVKKNKELVVKEKKLDKEIAKEDYEKKHPYLTGLEKKGSAAAKEFLKASGKSWGRVTAYASKEGQSTGRRGRRKYETIYRESRQRRESNIRKERAGSGRLPERGRGSGLAQGISYEYAPSQQMDYISSRPQDASVISSKNERDYFGGSALMTIGSTSRSRKPAGVENLIGGQNIAFYGKQKKNTIGKKKNDLLGDGLGLNKKTADLFSSHKETSLFGSKGVHKGNGNNSLKNLLKINKNQRYY